jgi:TIGR00266 family protein
MEYKILYEGAYPIIQCKLRQGESMQAESDAMVSMSATLDIEGSINGGLLGGLARRMLTNESFFFQTVTARRGPGEVLFASSLPGGVIDVELDGSYALKVQKDGYLASTPGIQVTTKAQNLVQGLFSREGFFVLGVSGRGTVFLSSYGSIHPINLEAGEEVIIDNGHLVAWSDYMNYTIEKASNGWMSSFMSGEMLVCRFRGPGTVLIQTRNPSAFASWIRAVAGTSK